MSLEKAIASGKEHRKQYRGKNWCKLIDPSCRNHGSCIWCKNNRSYNSRKRLEKSEYREE